MCLRNPEPGDACKYYDLQENVLVLQAAAIVTFARVRSWIPPDAIAAHKVSEEPQEKQGFTVKNSLLFIILA
jgi:hypothetical protein